MAVTSARILNRLGIARVNRRLQPLLTHLFEIGQPLHANAFLAFNNGPPQHLLDTDADADRLIDILNERLALLAVVNAARVRIEICDTLGVPANTLNAVPDIELINIQQEARSLAQEEATRIDSIKAINARAGGKAITAGPLREWALKKLPKFIDQANNLNPPTPTLDEKIIPFLNKKLLENPQLTRAEFCAWLANNSVGRNYTRGCGIPDAKYHPDGSEYEAMQKRVALIAKKETFEQRKAELQREIKQVLRIAELHIAGKPNAAAYQQDAAECHRLFTERGEVLTLQLAQLNVQEAKLRAEISMYQDIEQQIPEVKEIIQRQLEEKAVVAGNNRVSRWLRKEFAGLWSGAYKLAWVGPAVGTERDLVSGEREQELVKIYKGLTSLMKSVHEKRDILQKEIKVSENEALKAQHVLQALEEVKFNLPADVRPDSIIIPSFGTQRKKHVVPITPVTIIDKDEIQILEQQAFESTALRITAAGVVPAPIMPAVAGFAINNNQGLLDVAVQYIKPGEKVYLNENGFVHSYLLNEEKTFFSLELHNAPGGWRWYLSSSSRDEYCNYFVKKALEAFAVFKQFPANSQIVFPDLHDKIIESMLYEALLAVIKIKNWEIPIILPPGKEQSFKDPSVRSEMLKAAQRLALDTRPMQEEIEAVRQTLRL